MTPRIPRSAHAAVRLQSASDSLGRAFASLDPDDPRALPDGSRLVDALELRLVVLHVAGRAP